MHQLNIVITLAAGLAVALAFGALTRRLGLSTLVGYLLAGLVVGPYTPGFVADQGLAAQLAEIGVILLMFGVGLHFHPQELLRVWRLAVPGAVGQSIVAACAGWGMARLLGWSDAAGVVFGMALAVASTVVLMRMLVENGRLSSADGHAAVGWLIVEDLFTVAALVVLPVLAQPAGEGGSLVTEMGLALLKVVVFAAVVALAGTRLVSRLLERAARTRSSELFTLSVFVVALGIAALAAEVFHVSVALGAFFAGLVVGQSRFGAQAAADMAPFRDVFSALFFVSVGMLFDPSFVVQQPLIVLGVLAIVLLLKPLVAWIIVLLLREKRRTAATVAVGLAQIGEFSFILASLGVSSGVLPSIAMDALVVGAIVSISINPLLFAAADRWMARLPDEQPLPPVSAARQVAVILTGRGPLARRFAARCVEAGVSLCLIEDDADEAGEDRPDVVFGDAGRPEVLTAAGAADARLLVITGLPLSQKIRVCTATRTVNPRLEIIAAADGEAEAGWLREFGVGVVCDATDELSDQLARAVRARL